jgi:hypothetical protein
MASYLVTYQIDIDADTPLQAARVADDYMQRENRAFSPVFSIINSETGESCVIDLDEVSQ